MDDGTHHFSIAANKITGTDGIRLLTYFRGNHSPKLQQHHIIISNEHGQYLEGKYFGERSSEQFFPTTSTEQPRDDNSSRPLDRITIGTGTTGPSLDEFLTMPMDHIVVGISPALHFPLGRRFISLPPWVPTIYANFDKKKGAYRLSLEVKRERRNIGRDLTVLLGYVLRN